MHGRAAVSGRRVLETGTVAIAALLSPVVFLVSLFPARLLAWPFLGLLEPFGDPGLLLAWSAWFCVCSLILLACLSFGARALEISPRARATLVTATWLWAVVPNIALIVLFTTAPD